MSSGASPELQAVAEAIFQVVLESSLGEARQGAADDEEEGEAAAEAGPDGDNTIHESFSRTAVFGRCCLPQAIAILGGLLQERINRATTSAAMGTTPSLPVNFLAWNSAAEHSWAKTDPTIMFHLVAHLLPGLFASSSSCWQFR